MCMLSKPPPDRRRPLPRSSGAASNYHHRRGLRAQLSRRPSPVEVSCIGYGSSRTALGATPVTHLNTLIYPHAHGFAMSCGTLLLFTTLLAVAAAVFTTPETPLTGKGFSRVMDTGLPEARFVWGVFKGDV
ncbi:Protein of unknown function [Gryllus bimaculatus]|nr:Protein of unknown function [Gryllus bimaculatus]